MSWVLFLVEGAEAGRSVKKRKKNPFFFFILFSRQRIISMSFHYYNTRSLFLMARWVKELKELLRRLRTSISGVNCKCYSSAFIKSIFKKRALAITGLAHEVIPAWGHDNARWWGWVIRSLMGDTTRAVALQVHLSSLPPNDKSPNLHRPRDQRKNRRDAAAWGQRAWQKYLSSWMQHHSALTLVTSGRVGGVVHSWLYKCGYPHGWELVFRSLAACFPVTGLAFHVEAVRLSSLSLQKET